MSQPWARAPSAGSRPREALAHRRRGGRILSLADIHTVESTFAKMAPGHDDLFVNAVVVSAKDQ